MVERVGGEDGGYRKTSLASQGAGQPRSVLLASRGRSDVIRGPSGRAAKSWQHQLGDFTQLQEEGEEDRSSKTLNRDSARVIYLGLEMYLRFTSTSLVRPHRPLFVYVFIARI